MTLAVLLGSVGASFALPKCEGSPTEDESVWVQWHDCEGTNTFANGTEYVGEYRDGKPNGQGTYFFPNGDEYVGELKDGKPDGQGTLTFADGRVEGHRWENGNLKPWWKFW